MRVPTIQKSGLSDAETLQARKLALALAAQKPGRAKIQIRIDNKYEDVPKHAVPLIAKIMEKMGAGQSVEVRSIHEFLSTTEAAEVLNVSRPYVVKLLDQGLIPCVTTEGNHRRIERTDLLNFKARKDEERRKFVNALAVEGQRLNREHKLDR